MRVDDEEFEAPRLSKSRAVVAFIVLLAISFIASTLAGTIRINSNNRVEFGQGLYNLKACDSFVGINLRSGSGANLNYVKYLELSGFDKTKCKNKFFTIKLQGSGSNLNLFNYQEPDPANCGVTSLSNATVTTVSGKCVVTFTANGSAVLPSGITTIDYLVVGGGGSGGNNRGGGGGAGAFVSNSNITLTSRNVSATIGAGGASVSATSPPPAGNDGGSSSLTINTSTTISAVGGGGGGSHNAKFASETAPEPGRTGGSGGGGSINYVTYANSGGAALNSNYGNSGGNSSSTNDSSRFTGGGGGAGGVGKNGSASQTPDGGIGKLDFLGNYIAAGGGGADGRGYIGSSPSCETAYSSSGAGSGGTGGGGIGQMTCTNQSQSARSATSGQANTGSGGGGAISSNSGAGGSGVVQVRFTPNSSPITTSDKLVLRVNNDSNPSVFLVYTYGSNAGTDIPAEGDSYQKLTYSSGIYTVEFLNPIVLVANVTGTTFESASSYS